MPTSSDALNIPPTGEGRAWFVLTPHLNGIEPECEMALQLLERSGVRVVRRCGCSQIDVARNEMLSDALHDGAEAILFIDADTGFEAQDALSPLGATRAGHIGRSRQERVGARWPAYSPTA